MASMVDIFMRYKAHNASNLDGGGSSTLAINGEVINNPKGYGYEGGRYLVNAWALVDKEDEIQELNDEENTIIGEEF